MDIIFAKIILKDEGRIITKRNLINDGVDYEIFDNENKF